MRTLTGSHRALVATAVSLVVSLSLAGCSQLSQSVVASPTMVGCLLAQFHGDLVAENGRPVLKTAGANWGGRTTVPLDWPDGWTIRATDDGQFEVLDRNGSVQVSTGTPIVLLTDPDSNTPEFNRDGEFVVCAADPFAP